MQPADSVPLFGTLHPLSRLYPHQRQAAAWLAQRYAGLLGLSPGLGKTAAAIAALQLRGARRTVVVCPLTLLSTWERELEEWWPGVHVHRFESWNTTAPPRHEPAVILTTYDRLRRYGLPLARPEVLIFDESVLLKSRRAQRTHAVKEARKGALTCWMLSGSPTTRFNDDLWAQLNILDRGTYRSYWRFTYRWCLISRSPWGDKITHNLPHAEADLRRELRDHFYTYSYDDLAREYPQLAIPEWEFDRRDVPLTSAMWKVYRQMERDWMAQLPSGDTVLVGNVLTKFLRLLQLATGPWLLEDAPVPTRARWGGKTAAVGELLESLPGPTLLWTAFKPTAQQLGERHGAPVLTGDTPADKRTRIVREFQEGEHPTLVAHPGVGRFGLTLTRARSAVYVERTYDGDAFYQSLYRNRRLGTVEPPRVVLLRATGPNGEPTVDHVVDRVLDYRSNAARRLTTNMVREVIEG